MSQAMNEKVIWDFLMEKTRNSYGTAAIMGNLMAESSLNPLCATGKNRTPDYALDADSGKVDFVNDGVAFGLVQWCYKTRKEGLINYACTRGTSVGNLRTQLEYLVQEMSQHYKTAWQAVTMATDIRSASDVVMLKYEKPAGTSEKAKQKRYEYGLKFFKEFTGMVPVNSTKTQQEAENAAKTQQSGKKMVRAKVNVNLRAGRGTGTAQVGEVKKGTELEWIATQNGWHKVAVWVSGDFTEVTS